MDQVVAGADTAARRTGARTASAPALARRLLRRAVHFLSYNLVLKRRGTRFARTGGFRLLVGPTVFDPRYFVGSEYFSRFLATLDLRGASVLDIGTGSGILALAAARAGAARVLAIDINPNAARSASANALAHGFADRMSVVCGDLLAAIGPCAKFDVVLSNPPFFAGEPIDTADRAWHAGPNYRDIAALFEQARAHLAPGGRCYILLSSDSDLGILTPMIEQAGFEARVIGERSLVIESLLLFELRAN